MTSTRHNKRGFTIIETLVVVGIFTILIIGVTELIKTIFIGSGQGTLALDNVDQSRVAEYNFTNELRNVTTGSDGSYPLNQAGTSQIILYTRYGGNGATVNRVRYFIATTTLYKGTITPIGTPPVYNAGSEKISIVQSHLASTSTPIFYYYDSSYAGTTTPLSQPVNLNNVKFVEMRLNVLSQVVRNATTTFTVSAGASLRNLKTNLGN